MYLVYYLALVSLLQGDKVKYWRHSNSWSHPASWDVSPGPCDAVILPDLGYDYSVLVSSKVHMNSLEFPSSGEVIFGDRASMSLSSLQQCLSPLGNTYRPRQYSWGDPNNWDTGPDSDTFARADSDRIPCWTDTVIFNKSSVFNVLVEAPVEVGALYLGEQHLDTQQVRSYVAGPGRAQLQFINLAELVVTGRNVCTNPEGCLCGNQLDCSLVQCPRQHCVKPIQSKGICCHYCGAEIRFRPPAGFYLLKFKERLSSFLRDTQQLDKKVGVTVSLQEYELRLNIQITVSDSIADGNYEGAGYESSKIADSIHKYIVDYDIVRLGDLVLERSHQPYTVETQETKDMSPSLTAGVSSWVLYLVLSVSLVLLIVIIVLLVRCSRRYRDNSQNNIRLDHGAPPRAIDRRFKPCVPNLDQDIPTYEEVLMEDMLQRGTGRAGPRGIQGQGYNEVPSSDTAERV